MGQGEVVSPKGTHSISLVPRLHGNEANTAWLCLGLTVERPWLALGGLICRVWPKQT